MDKVRWLGLPLNLLRQDPMKRSIPKKRLCAALHDEYPASVSGLFSLTI
jgi:hypothetical protein